MSLSIQGDDFNAPTNPQLTSTTADFSDGDRIYTAITSIGNPSISIQGWGGTVSEYSNLGTTKGFRIKCFNSLTSEGIRFNPSELQLNTNDYFVLLYSDSPFQHHFAKITEVKTEDAYGDAFEFKPKLGNEIPKDTKFIIFEMVKNTNVVAISLGLLQDSSADLVDELARRMVVARPHFYFYDGLDKPNELNHNTKYYAVRECGTANSYTLDNTDPSKTFVTVQDFGNIIVDYSKFSHRVKLTDKLEELDSLQASNYTSNEGRTGVANTTIFNQTYINANRILDDEINSPNYIGPTRYLHYDYSPTKSNILYNVVEHTNTESIDGKGGFAETLIIDNARIMPSKIKEFYSYRVRHNIHRGELNSFFPLKATYSSNSGNVYTFDTEYDLEDVLNDGDEIKLGDNIFIIEDFGLLSGNTQTITVENDGTDPYVRGDNEGVFTAQAISPSSGDVLNRRAYNATNGTLMLDISLLNGRFSKMYVSFTSLNHNERFATITACDAVKGMITLFFDDDSYTSNALSFAKGQYQIFIERFNGEVENIESRKEDGQTIMEIQGRDKFSKLLSPVVNLNTLFSEDIIYSTKSYYNQLTSIKTSTSFSVVATDDASKGDRLISTGTTSLNQLPVVGDYLFTTDIYIGEVQTIDLISGITYKIYLKTTDNIAYSGEIFVNRNIKNYMLLKALGASHLDSIKPSTLTGSANKGLIFNSGNEINISTGVEGNTLVGTSSNSGSQAIGYAINSPSSISNDLNFQTRLKDEHGTDAYSNFDTINTLIDFEVVSITKKENITQLELSPYIPITLGRLAEYHDYKNEYTFTEVATVSQSQVGTNDFAFTTLSSTAYTLIKDTPLFMGENKIYIGKVLEIVNQTISYATVFNVYLDRAVGDIPLSSKIYTADVKIHNVATINGEHLWGGKTIGLIHPKNDSSLGTIGFNIENTNGSGHYSNKYGNFIYHPIKFSKGNFGSNIGNITSSNQADRKLYDSPSKRNYLTSAYRVSPYSENNNIINWDKTDSAFRTFSIDYRGQTSTYGSNLTDVRIDKNRTKNAFINPSYALGLISRSHIFLDDSAQRLFLYANYDLLPYSSKRTDSLMSGNKNLNNYNLFLVNTNEQLSDANFQDLNFSSDLDISSIKRFGLMRLTEVCYDCFFNPVNPEKNLKEKIKGYANIPLAFDVVVLPDISSAGLSTITFDTNPSPALSSGDKIYDTNGNYICEIDSFVSGSTYNIPSGTFIYLTNNGSIATSCVKITTTQKEIAGRNTINSYKFHLLNSIPHPLKTVIIPKLTNVVSLATDSEIILPIYIHLGFSNSYDGYELKVLHDFLSHQKTYNNMKGVVLDRFSIEDGGKYPVHVGATTSSIIGGTYHQDTASSPSPYEGIVLKTSEHFKSYNNITDKYSSTTNYDSEGIDGAYMVFKPILKIDASSETYPILQSSTTISSSNGNVYKAIISCTSDQNHANSFLKFIDLTGCYLVAEKGELFQTTITNSADSRSVNGLKTEELIYVISHEPDNTTDNHFHLITDIELSYATNYRILQPNETFSYSFFPKDIELNSLNSKYTKIANKNEIYNIKDNYFLKKTTDYGDTLGDEGILSMFVAIDLDKQSSDDGIVIKDVDNFINDILSEGEHDLHISDGNTSKKIKINMNNEGILNFSNIYDLNGVVSVSETFLVTSKQEVKIDANRACIGSTVSIGLEGEDLINELLEQEGIEFTTTSTDVPMYLAPNYQGINLYSAIRYILDRKEMKLVEENNVFKIFPDDENSVKTNITIDDSDNFLISNFEKVSTLFDFFNEIIVYGNIHKAIRKDLRSIQKRGRKTLEVVDNTLLTQEEADKKATKLLRLHSSLNQKLSFTMQNKGINQLRVGDIVNVSIPRENIEMNKYIVLEMEHQLKGFIKLQLGRYSKDLSDVFSELLVSSKETKAALRSNELTSNEISYNFINTLDTKELKLEIRKTESSGGATLGFGTAFNTATTPFGFNAGITTITDLLEEDLI